MFNGKKQNSMALAVSCSVISALAIAVYALLSDDFSESKLAFGIVCILGCIALQFCAYFIILITSKSFSQNTAELQNALGGRGFGIVSELDIPVLVCKKSGDIIWANKAFSSAAKNAGLAKAQSFGDICDIPTDEIASAENGVSIALSDRIYRVRLHELNTASGNTLFFTVWEDISETQELAKRIHDENILTAFIAIDNLDELYQYVQERFNTASGEVSSILNKWAKENNGILIEYAKDKFLFLFEAQCLPRFIENKFDILDRVRNVNVGDGGLPVTVSIGIAASGNSLTEKEKIARNALDTALQRGGDQVVVKSDAGTEYYGARVQTAQKLTKVRARVFGTKLAEMIASADNVLIMAHCHPDFDAIGACLGLARLSMYCGTKVNIITDFSSDDVNKCIDKLRSVPEYASDGIFVDASEAQEMLSGNTLLIIADVNNPSQFEAPNIADNAPQIVYIDHHRKFGDLEGDNTLVYIEPSNSSTCELVAEILEYAMNDGSLTREEADIMLAGIMLDTKQFLRNTGSRTFGAALFLRKEGATSANAQELFKTGLDDLTREAAYETNVSIYRSCIAISHSSTGTNPSVDRVAAAKAADKLLGVKGIAASFVLCDMGNTVHISARSAGKINVQLIVEKLGGGGHFESAATQLNSVTTEEAVTLLKAAIDNYLEENDVRLS